MIFKTHQVTKFSTPDVRSRFKSIGWVAEIGPDCVNCGQCVDVCPQHAISPGSEKMMVGEPCFGCGLCKANCSKNAIQIVPKNELAMKNMKEYFSGLDLEL